MSKKAKSKVKLKKDAYIVRFPFKLGDKSYTVGSKVYLTKEGAAYYKSIKKI